MLQKELKGKKNREKHHLSENTKSNLKIAGGFTAGLIILGGVISAAAVPISMIKSDRNQKLNTLNETDNKIVETVREKSGYDDFIPHTLQFEDDGNYSILGTAKEKFGKDTASAYIKLSFEGNKDDSYKVASAFENFKTNVPSSKISENFFSGSFDNEYTRANSYDWDNYNNYYNLHNEVLNLLENSSNYYVNVIGNSKDFNNSLLKSCLFSNPTVLPEISTTIKSFFSRIDLSSELISNGTAVFNISNLENQDDKKIFYIDYIKFLGDDMEAERAKISITGENLSEKEAYDCFIYDLDNVRFSIVDSQKINENNQLEYTEDFLLI